MALREKYSKRLGRFFKSLDYFGHPVTLKYKTRSTYNSILGGVMTTIVFTALLGYFLSMINDVIIKKQFQVLNTTVKRNMAFDSTPMVLTKDNFDIGILMYYNGELSIQNDIDLYFQYNIQIGTFEYALDFNQSADFGNSYSLSTQNLTLELCGPDRFGGKELGADILGITGIYYCPKDDFKFTLFGSYSSQKASIIQVLVHYCSQDYLNTKFPGQNKICKTKEEADQIINNAQIYLPIKTQYFEQSDFTDNPIKSSINMDIYQILNPDLSINRVFKISENFVTLEDSIWSSNLEMKQNTYIDFRIANDYSPRVDLSQNLPLLTLQFVLDETSINFSRSVTTLLDAFSQIGGFFTIAIAIVFVLISWYQEAKFRSHVLKKLFWVHRDDLVKFNPPLRRLQAFQGSPKNSNKSSDNKLKKAFGNFLGNQVVKLDQEKQKKLDELSDYIQNLSGFVYRVKDVVRFQLRRVLRFFNKKSRDRLQDKLYLKGVKRLEDQFDIIQIFKSLRKTHLLTQVQLSKYQQTLLPFLRHNILDDDPPLKDPMDGYNDVDAMPNYKLSRKSTGDLSDSDNEENENIPKEKIYNYLRDLIYNSQTQRIDFRILKNLMKFKKDIIISEQDREKSPRSHFQNDTFRNNTHQLSQSSQLYTEQNIDDHSRKQFIHLQKIGGSNQRQSEGDQKQHYLHSIQERQEDNYENNKHEGPKPRVSSTRYPSKTDILIRNAI